MNQSVVCDRACEMHDMDVDICAFHMCLRLLQSQTGESELHVVGFLGLGESSLEIAFRPVQGMKFSK